MYYTEKLSDGVYKCLLMGLSNKNRSGMAYDRDHLVEALAKRCSGGAENERFIYSKTPVVGEADQYSQDDMDRLFASPSEEFRIGVVHDFVIEEFNGEPCLFGTVTLDMKHHDQEHLQVVVNAFESHNSDFYISFLGASLPEQQCIGRPRCLITLNYFYFDKAPPEVEDRIDHERVPEWCFKDYNKTEMA